MGNASMSIVVYTHEIEKEGCLIHTFNLRVCGSLIVLSGFEIARKRKQNNNNLSLPNFSCVLSQTLDLHVSSVSIF